MLNKVNYYIEKHNMDIDPESVIAEFERANQLHKEFEQHLKDNKMQRNSKLLERRRLFVEFYINKYQNQKSIKTMMIELSEMTFNSISTIEKDFYNRKKHVTTA